MLKSRLNADAVKEVMERMNERTIASKGATNYTPEERILHWPLSSVRLEHVVYFATEYLAAVKEADLDFFNDHMATLEANKPYCLCRTQTGDRKAAGKYWFFDPNSGCLNIRAKKEKKLVDGKEVVTVKRSCEVIHPETNERSFIRQRELKNSMTTGYTNAVEVTAEQAVAAFGGRSPIDVVMAISPMNAGGLNLEPDWNDKDLQTQILADLEDGTVTVDSTPPRDEATPPSDFDDTSSVTDEEVPF